jgi:hypothetical protein
MQVQPTIFEEDKDLIQHSTKRIKKKIIDFILFNYKSLFFGNEKETEKEESKERYSVSEETILSN